MKKDIKWLKNKVLTLKETYITARDKFEPHSWNSKIYNGMLNSVTLILYFINELDEPEVLSQEWIDNNSINASSDGVTEEYVHVDDLENLIIPKQELPVIPQFVADYLEKAKEEIDLLRVFEIANGLDELDMWRKEYNWIRLYHLDFARAWLSGYEVEEEQKYNVKIEGKSLSGAMGIFLYKQGDEVLVGDNFSAYYPEKDKFRLTEQEIKDYDSRYWAFRKPVNEVVSE